MDRLSNGRQTASHIKPKVKNSPLTCIGPTACTYSIDSGGHGGWWVQWEVPVFAALLLLLPTSQPRIPRAVPAVETVVRPVALVVGGRGAEAGRGERKARAQGSLRLLGRPPAPPGGWARGQGSPGPRGRLRGGWGHRTEAACFPLSAGHVRWCGPRSSAGDSCTPPWPRRYRVWGEAGGSEPERWPVLSAHSATDWSPLQNKKKKN